MRKGRRPPPHPGAPAQPTIKSLHVRRSPSAPPHRVTSTADVSGPAGKPPPVSQLRLPVPLLLDLLPSPTGPLAVEQQAERKDPTSAAAGPSIADRSTASTERKGDTTEPETLMRRRSRSSAPTARGLASDQQRPPAGAALKKLPLPSSSASAGARRKGKVKKGDTNVPEPVPMGLAAESRPSSPEDVMGGAKTDNEVPASSAVLPMSSVDEDRFFERLSSLSMWNFPEYKMPSLLVPPYRAEPLKASLFSQVPVPSAPSRTSLPSTKANVARRAKPTRTKSTASTIRPNSATAAASVRSSGQYLRAPAPKGVLREAKSLRAKILGDTMRMCKSFTEQVFPSEARKLAATLTAVDRLNRRLKRLNKTTLSSRADHTARTPATKARLATQSAARPSNEATASPTLNAKSRTDSPVFTFRGRPSPLSAVDASLPRFGWGDSPQARTRQTDNMEMRSVLRCEDFDTSALKQALLRHRTRPCADPPPYDGQDGDAQQREAAETYSYGTEHDDISPRDALTAPRVAAAASVDHADYQMRVTALCNAVRALCDALERPGAPSTPHPSALSPPWCKKAAGSCREDTETDHTGDSPVHPLSGISSPAPPSRGPGSPKEAIQTSDKGDAIKRPTPPSSPTKAVSQQRGIRGIEERTTTESDGESLKESRGWYWTDVQSERMKVFDIWADGDISRLPRYESTVIGSRLGSMLHKKGRFTSPRYLTRHWPPEQPENRDETVALGTTSLPTSPTPQPCIVCPAAPPVHGAMPTSAPRQDKRKRCLLCGSFP
ncbi:unnamed protein product [Vitrella brassicaformis CCMP3155]|uniref:Uncharacterized protein n=3 Tax=Vitrella brassicaformis TaxID=1169539 RepID=A0A0G4H6H0_VITBC|nr:unnamed protein product [Vitrella brassicaformis CCMP3155]|eukprot:CEM39316.1 unnamed protein product [Vitrella brassicaformis CCMP3155]